MFTLWEVLEGTCIVCRESSHPNLNHTHTTPPPPKHIHTPNIHTHTHTHTHTQHTHHTHTDGTPGAVQGLAQVNQPSLYCVTVGWSGAPFPPNGPILLYTVTLTTEMGVVQATYNVSAEDVMQCTLCGLLPDTSYSVAMVALNNYGYGDPSSNVTVRTATPIGV